MSRSPDSETLLATYQRVEVTRRLPFNSYLHNYLMVCPVCITSAIVAGAPSLAAGLGGIAAIKLAINRTIGSRECVSKTKIEMEKVKSIGVFRASSGIQEGLQKERERMLHPEPIRVEVRDKWWKPLSHHKWDDM